MTFEEFSKLINLADDRLGARIISVTDDFFAEAENMLKPGRGIFIDGKYTDRGKWMDGWESRRKRVPGHDHAVVKLGLRGVIRGVDIDTNFFLDNHPPFASIEAADCEGNPEEKDWVEILTKSPLKPGSQNPYAITSDKSWTHLRLHIYPDGGVARFKVYGDVTPNWSKIAGSDVIDYAAVQNGGRALLANDMFFSSKDNINMPGRGKTMGDGWETRRKREPGYDWLILKLGRPTVVRQLEVDTCHFKGNYPDTCSLEAINSSLSAEELAKSGDWKPLLERTKLQPNTQHYFQSRELKFNGKATHVRLNIFPDGGVSRLRVLGSAE